MTEPSRFQKMLLTLFEKWLRSKWSDCGVTNQRYFVKIHFLQTVFLKDTWNNFLLKSQENFAMEFIFRNITGHNFISEDHLEYCFYLSLNNTVNGVQLMDYRTMTLIKINSSKGIFQWFYLKHKNVPIQQNTIEC